MLARRQRQIFFPDPQLRIPIPLTPLGFDRLAILGDFQNSDANSVVPLVFANVLAVPAVFRANRQVAHKSIAVILVAAIERDLLAHLECRVSFHRNVRAKRANPTLLCRVRTNRSANAQQREANAGEQRDTPPYVSARVHITVPTHSKAAANSMM